MEAEKIEKFHILVFSNGTKENKELLLENNPGIKKLLENSTFDVEYVLSTLYLLSHDLNDNIARQILVSKLKDVYETGDIGLIDDCLGYFDGLNVDDLLFLIFESNSPLTRNLLSSLEKCSLSVDSLKEFLIKLSKEDYVATVYLLTESFLLKGTKVRTGYRFRDGVSQWHIWEEFNSFRHDQDANRK
ncbi:MAG: hypothetical protein ACTSR5_16880 [Promethearchaeota archaeon]